MAAAADGEDDIVTKVVVKIPVFHSKVIIYLGKSKIKPKGYEDIFHGEYFARCGHRKEDGDLVVVMHCQTYAMSVIAHEAIHASSYILEKIGHKASFKNDEVQAYLVQHILEAVENKLYDR
jgi:hypothetical protein